MTCAGLLCMTLNTEGRYCPLNSAASALKTSHQRSFVSVPTASILSLSTHAKNIYLYGLPKMIKHFIRKIISIGITLYQTKSSAGSNKPHKVMHA
jgi:hypothetical protein